MSIKTRKCDEKIYEEREYSKERNRCKYVWTEMMEPDWRQPLPATSAFPWPTLRVISWHLDK